MTILIAKLKWVRVLLILGLMLQPMAMFDAAAGADVTTSNSRVDFTDMLLPILPPCTPDIVSLSGTLHVLMHSTSDDNGGVHMVGWTQFQNLSGTSLFTGAAYRATEVYSDPFLFNGTSGGAAEGTFLGNFRIIGRGQAQNYLVHFNMHMTFNANGEMTSSVDNTTMECK